MGDIETDYLVVGAGATGMAFVDTLIAESDANVVIVDRRHRPGGHWLDAYPFVRLHQPSANYGVNSRRLGNDRIDESGPNAGFYERATAAEICDYFNRVLVEDLIPTGRVRFLGMSDYQGTDTEGHHVVSLLTGATTTIKVRRRLVDATYVESSIPSRHTPGYAIDPQVRLIPPNDLVDLDEPAGGFTVLGAGKTAMDTCNWLLDAGVDPGAIHWVRPRDPWLFNRAAMQPLDLVGAYMQMQASWVASAATCVDGASFARDLEDRGVFVRIDSRIEPEAFRGATISLQELESLRSIEHVVRCRVHRIGVRGMATDQGEVETAAGSVYVDCTAAGVRPTVARPIFEGDRMTLQYTTIGIVPWGAATIAAVEARPDDDAEKNRLCPVLAFTGAVADIPTLSLAGMSGLMVRGSDPALSTWAEASRLNPIAGVMNHMDDPRVPAAFETLGANIGPALANLARVTEGEAAGVGA
jgi:hypothetical protein